MTQVDRQQSVMNLLTTMRGLDPLKKLFWSELNYQRVNQPLSRRNWSDTAASALAEDPLLFAGGGQDDDFHIIYARLASHRLLLGRERPVASRLLKEHPYALFVFSNDSQDRWHFVNVKYDGELTKRRLFRRITVGPEERLRTASERLAKIDLESIQPDLFGLSALAVQERHDEAFDVEAVTKQFFEEYDVAFRILRDDLRRQTNDRSWAHDYALQFLNRCMFLYFIQRKGWLADDREFLRSFWEDYQLSGHGGDSFVNKWLKVLFFEAFNNKFHGGHAYFPTRIKEALSLAPFLNGGLFLENDLDHRYNVTISDKRFEQAFKFLERYNFTVAEDSPLDKEVAVDPEMIGKVYESLVNVSEEVDERGEAGIFYTPRTEIDLMCRLALVDNLANHLGAAYKSLLYQSVFALEPDEKVNADEAVTNAHLWRSLNERLREIAVLDPACGSGSFLVGMLHILDDLQERANRCLGFAESSYDRKKRIIGQSLYGVDVMEWACRVAELRLWLALVVDAEITREELHIRHEPLLPHFSFKIRCGDSLVQDVGGINLGHLRASHGIPGALRARITRLKNEKLKFYNNDSSCQFHSPNELKQDEKRLFVDILGARQKRIEEDVKALRRRIEGPQERRIRLDGTVEERSHQMDLEATKSRQLLDSLTIELDQVKQANAALKTATVVPFVWDISFVEVFEGERQGFDIVIGNPPYVRQEAIAAPIVCGIRNSEDKKEYRAKLAQSVYQAFPTFFGYKPRENSAVHKLDAKSDLYVYFYFHGLSLLNPRGAFCFITSNSWLDVGYGHDLQEFLLKHGHVKMVLDNQAKRSFSADVNTVIVLMAAPDDTNVVGRDRVARFIMFKVPFDQIVSPVIFDELESANDPKITPEYRVYPVQQDRLFQEGCKQTEESERTARPTGTRGALVEVASYAGNKWGGKYLRAPDIYYTVLEKGASYIRCLSDYFDGERYLNTGGADGFFIITNAEPVSDTRFRVSNSNTTGKNLPFDGEIENKYLAPLIKDYTKTDKRMQIHGYDAHCLVVQGSLTRNLERYIEWGELQGYHERSVTRTQTPWYKPTRQMLAGARILIPRSFNDTFVMFYNPESYLSLRFYRLHIKKGRERSLVAFLNTTLVALVMETLGNKSLGQGVLDFYMADFLALRIPVIENPELERAFDEAKNHEVVSVREEYGLSTSEKSRRSSFKPRPPRKRLDDVVFDTLRLSAGERDAVYEAVIDLVDKRLSKAQSLKPGERTKRLAAASKTRGIWANLPPEREDDEPEE